MLKDYFKDNTTKDELRFVEYLGVKNGKDVHLLKLNKYQEDGSYEPAVEYIEDFEMPFWVTKKIFRNHKDTKEYCSTKELDMFTSPQSRIYKEAAKRLGMPAPEYKSRRQVTPSPFIYGLDITCSSYIKDWYIRNGTSSDWNVATYDLEVDIENFSDQYITHASLATDEKSYLYVLRSRFPRQDFPTDESIREAIAMEYIANAPNGEEMWESKERKIFLMKTSTEILEASIAMLHEWSPDIVGIWNSNYDVNKIIDEYEGKAGRSLAQLFHDPSLPKHLAHFSYKEGKNKIITILDNGKEKSKTFKPHQVHHDLVTSASFKIVDAMGLYFQIRSQGADEEGGYSLDNVANNNIGQSKMHDDSKLVKAAWHVFTSKYRPAFYAAYSKFDSDIMINVDNKTKDLKTTAHSQLGAGLWSKFNSLPYRLHVAFQFNILPLGFAVGTRSSDMESDPILGIGEGWIVTVPAYKMKLPYDSNILDDNFKGTRTTHFAHGYDMDEVAAYPRATVAGNVSKGTTYAEVITIDDKKKDDFLQINLGLIVNKSNSQTFAKHHLNHPTFELLTDPNILI